MKTPIVLGLFAATAISALALACTVSPGVDGAEGVEEGDPAGPTTTTTPEEPATPVALPEEDAGASGTAPDARGEVDSPQVDLGPVARTPRRR
jgi:hypothetical protein